MEPADVEWTFLLGSHSKITVKARFEYSHSVVSRIIDGIALGKGALDGVMAVPCTQVV